MLGSSFGPAAVVWTEAGSRARVLRVFLPGRGGGCSSAMRAFPGAVERTCPEMKRLTRVIERLLTGADVSFDLESVALDCCSVFQQQVLRAEHAVPRGRVTTHGRLAAQADRPCAARAAGDALATNLLPLIVPCHRAVGSGGGLGGYQGGTSMKRALLEMEGVGFRPEGRVLPALLLP
ncbi:MAG: methylated-DNA--[protein]-cysteine S-methyltransferase [candidate division WOR-3 bacterium]|nr:MAG: methylated-DNA--[protein]-cysteine S-methyltransferase [candidate division WOR-3 bacterium]